MVCCPQWFISLCNMSLLILLISFDARSVVVFYYFFFLGLLFEPEVSFVLFLGDLGSLI